jgi:hypothetical protein
MNAVVISEKKAGAPAGRGPSGRAPSSKSSTREHGLKSVVARAGSVRVLNLHGIASGAPDDEDYSDRPMFIHPVLNRCIIIKHNIPVGGEDKLAPRRFNATKIIFPFDQNDLNIGGQSLFVGQPNFTAALSALLDYTDLPLDRDMDVLLAMDQLPTLDPFLLREVLIKQQVDVGRCYCVLSEADKADMLAFVAGEIEALVRLCFRDADENGERSQHFAQLLLAEQNSVGLEPLREIFRMTKAEFSDAMFCWKAFLYYRWRSHAVGEALRSTLRSMLALPSDRYDRDEAELIVAAKEQVKQAVSMAWRQVGLRIRLYDQAFAALTDQQKPDAFRAFLIRGTSLFTELGTQIGQMEQVVSLWNYRFGAVRRGELTADDVLTGLRDLLGQIVPVSAPQALAIPV